MHADDLLGKVFETDVWLKPLLKGQPVVFQVYSISGDDVRVTVAPTSNTGERYAGQTQSISLDTLTAAIREGSVREWDGSPLHFLGG